MKKTILLAAALMAAGFLTMGGAARRNNGKTNGFNFLPILCIFCLCAILTACGGAPLPPAKFYQYKQGESNWHAALTKCVTYGKKQVVAMHGESYHDFNPYDPAHHIIMQEASVTYVTAEAECLSNLGWLQCSAGGQGRPECACLNPGPNGRPTCR